MKKHQNKNRNRLLLTAFMLLVLSGAGCSARNVETSEASSADVSQPAARPSEAPAVKESTEAETKEQPDMKTEEPETEAPEMICPVVLKQEEFPLTDGSTANLPLARMLYRITTGAEDFEAQEAMLFTTTNNCYTRLMEGAVEMVIAYEAGPDAKADPRFADLELKPVGLDALVFLCNEGNPVESLTAGQLKDIYSGKIRRWSEVGGVDKEIVAFQRTLNSGSQTLMQNLVMGDTPFMEAPAEWRPGEMGDLIDSVAAYNNEENSIGYSVYYYARNMYTLPGIRFMKVDGVEPSNASIQSGDYSFVNPFYVGIRNDTAGNSPARKLFDWLTTKDGQSLVEETGYVSLEAGGRKLPEVFTEKKEAFETDVPLAVRSELYDGTSGITVFDRHFKIAARYPEVRMAGNDSFEAIRGKVLPAALPEIVERIGEQLTDPPISRIGLMNVSDGSWAVEPTFSQICYDRKNGTDFRYGLIRKNDESDWDKGGLLEEYDKDGNLLRSETWENWDQYDALTRTYDRVPVDCVYEDDLTTINFGNDTKVIRSWKEESCILTCGENVYDRARHGYVLPAEGNEDNHSIPAGWNVVYLTDYEDTGIPENRVWIVDEKGTVVTGCRLGQKEYLCFLTKDYAVFGNDTGYSVTDLEFEPVCSWIYSDANYEQ